MIISLIRHALSEQNTGLVNSTVIGDKNVSITPDGIKQAICLGEQSGPEFFSDALIYCSPYLRTTQTLLWMMDGAGIWCQTPKIQTNEWSYPTIYFDPLLIEVNHGYNKGQTQIETEKELRKTHGWFYYQYQGGESPFDCYKRVSLFIDSLHRQMKRKRTSVARIVSHGFTIRCFVMRWFHLSEHQFNMLDNPENCDVITIMPRYAIENPQFVSGKWGVTGLRFRDKEEVKNRNQKPIVCI